MEKVLEATIDQHSGSGVLTAIVLVLCLHLLFGIGKFVFSLFKHKAENSDKQITQHSLELTQNTQALRELRIQLGVIERELIDMRKHGPDINKVFSAVKFIASKAGYEWSEVRKAMEDDSIPR